MKKYGIIIAVLSVLTAAAQSVSEAISRGNDYYRQTQFAQAEQEYRLALQREPGNTTAQYNLANALQKQKKYEEAARVLEALYGTAADKGLKSAAAYNNGVAQTKQKALEPSIEWYKNALRLNPADQQARENLQKALSELKKQQQSQQQQKQQSSSSMDQSQADQKLKLLQEKERQLQQRMQNAKKQQGGGGKDW